METSPVLRYFLVGQIRREYIISAEEKTFLNIPGGNALYAANGLAIWETGIGILSRVSSDFPDEWIDKITRKGFDTSGILRSKHPYNMNSIFVYRTPTTLSDEKPVSVFTRLGLTVPKSLLDMTENSEIQQAPSDDANEFIRFDEIPDAYLDASAVHICPINDLNQYLLPSALKQAHVTTISLDPSPTLMNPQSLSKFRDMARNITAIHISETKIRNLFNGISTDLWEMAEDLGNYGCEFVVIQRGALGQLLYVSENRNHWLIPAYPTSIQDITGVEDSFCGGFLAGYRNSYDPLEAALSGNISASFTVEGAGPFYGMDTLPELAKARLEILRPNVRKV